MYQSESKMYENLVSKMGNDAFVIQETEHNNVLINAVHRAVMTNKYIFKNFNRSSTIVDIACGDGYNACYLANAGFRVTGFDISESFISEAKNLAEELNLSKEDVVFEVNDHHYLLEIETGSVDIVSALGLMRFLEKDVIDFIYREVYRILKPGGSFIVSNENILFDIFALNNTTLVFWSKLMEEFSDVHKLFPEGGVLHAIKKKVNLPERKFHPKSISSHVQRSVENPLTYGDSMKANGFKLDCIFYPDCHIIPPFLLPEVDSNLVGKIRGEICLKRAEGDWRSMFLAFEFLSCFKKT